MYGVRTSYLYRYATSADTECHVKCVWHGKRIWHMFSNHYLWEPGKEKKWHRLDTVPQLLPCHTLICILLRLCLQAPRSCQAAVRKRAAGSQSCGWGGWGGRVRAQTIVRWKRSAKMNGESSAREAREGERGRRRRSAEIKTTKLYLDKELRSPSQTASNLQRLN